MGQGGFCFCEWDSVQRQDVNFQRAFANLESQMRTKCNAEWAPRSFGRLKAMESQYGRVPIFPALFDDWYDGTVKTAATSVPLNSAQAGGTFGGSPVGTWRQKINATGNMVLLHGAGAGDTITEDIKIAWIGMAFPNKQQHITELKWQIGDRKYGRNNIEEMHAYNKPAMIFEEGYIIDEETSFHLYGYLEGPLPAMHDGEECVYQRVVMLGAAYYKVKNKVLGAPASAVP